MPVPNASKLRVSAAFLVAFVLITVIEHALHPGLSPADHRVSEYATASPGWLMTLGFAAWSISLLTAAVGILASSLRPRRVVLAVSALLAVAAVGAAATAACKTGTRAGVVPAGHHLSLENHVHDLGSGLAGAALWCAAALSLTIADVRLRRTAGLLLTCAVAVTIAFAGGLLDLPGIRQRVLLVVACGWQLALLRSIDRG